MAIFERARRTGSHLRRGALDLVFPPVCAGCERIGTFLCEPCIAAMPPAAGPRCGRCWQSQPEGDCGACRLAPPQFEALRAPFVLAGPAREAVHRLKYGGLAAAGDALAARLATAWRSWSLPADIVVPVPLHPRRERLRGYNQAARLARPFAGRIGLPYEERALRRVRSTPALAAGALGRDARRLAVAGAFGAGVRADAVRGRTVALVDDVATTGATLSAAAEALLAAGATSVIAVVLARDAAPGAA